MGQQPIRNPLRLDLLGCLPERQRLGLREQVRQENVVVERQAKGDEVAWNEPRSLMYHLAKGVLAIVPGSPIYTGPVSQSTLEPGEFTVYFELVIHTTSPPRSSLFTAALLLAQICRLCPWLVASQKTAPAAPWPHP